MPGSRGIRLSRQAGQHRAASVLTSHVATPLGMSDSVNILLVDDQPGKLLSYEVMLRDLNENLIKTTSANEALQVLLKTDVDPLSIARVARARVSSVTTLG